MQTSVPPSDESNDTDIDEDRLEKRGPICIIRPVIRSSSSALTILYTHMHIHITSYAHTYVHTYINTCKQIFVYRWLHKYFMHETFLLCLHLLFLSNMRCLCCSDVNYDFSYRTTHVGSG
jgi:hypothetical protein